MGKLPKPVGFVFLKPRQTGASYAYDKFMSGDIVRKWGRQQVLHSNRKNRWSEETRKKYATIKEQAWLETQRVLINEDKV